MLICEVVAKGKMKSLALVDGYRVCGRADVTHMMVCPVCGVEDSFFCAEHAGKMLETIDSLKVIAGAGRFGRVLVKLLTPLVRYRFTECGHVGTLVAPVVVLKNITGN